MSRKSIWLSVVVSILLLMFSSCATVGGGGAGGMAVNAANAALGAAYGIDLGAKGVLAALLLQVLCCLGHSLPLTLSDPPLLGEMSL